MRLVDADELIEEMRGYGRGIADANCDRWTMMIAEAIVNKAKTVDVEMKSKKPVELTNVYPDGQYECPNCGAYVGGPTFYRTTFGEMVNDKKRTMYQYCVKCGQRIDWSEDNATD